MVQCILSKSSITCWLSLNKTYSAVLYFHFIFLTIAYHRVFLYLQHHFPTDLYWKLGMTLLHYALISKGNPFLSFFTIPAGVCIAFCNFFSLYMPGFFLQMVNVWFLFWNQNCIWTVSWIQWQMEVLRRLWSTSDLTCILRLIQRGSAFGRERLQHATQERITGISQLEGDPQNFSRAEIFPDGESGN